MSEALGSITLTTGGASGTCRIWEERYTCPECGETTTSNPATGFVATSVAAFDPEGREVWRGCRACLVSTLREARSRKAAW